MSSRHIHLEPLGGIAGDMFVAAMLDAFPQWREQVFADVSAVIPPEIGTIKLARVSKNGISALHFSLDEKLEGDPALAEAPVVPTVQDTADLNHRPSVYRPVHAAAAAMHVPGHRHAHDRHDPRSMPVSDYAGVRRLIEQVPLSGKTASHALAILEIIAQAESHIHGVALEKVHFHELAAWDSLMDVVAAGSLISALGKANWSISTLPLGSGQVRTQHGMLPVPAPATARILEGYPWRSDKVPGERVTPTGAAIVRYLVPPHLLPNRPEGMLRASGYGAGTKNFQEMANVLRVMVFDKNSGGQESEPSVVVMQFDVDDMSGEEIGVAAERLRKTEAVLDLLLVPAQGKKGRPVTMFQLLINPSCLDECCNLVFQETSTIGLRWSAMARRVLPRELHCSSDGRRVKTVQRPDGTPSTKIENDELESLAGLQIRRQVKATAEGS